MQLVRRGYLASGLARDFGLLSGLWTASRKLRRGRDDPLGLAGQFQEIERAAGTRSVVIRPRTRPLWRPSTLLQTRRSGRTR